MSPESIFLQCYHFWVDYNNYNWWLTTQKVILISQFNVILPRLISITFMLRCQISGRLLSRLIFQCIYIYISVSTGLELYRSDILQLSKWDEHLVLWLKSQKSPALCRWISIGDSGWCPFPCSIAGYPPRMCVETVDLDRDSSWRR